MDAETLRATAQQAAEQLPAATLYTFEPGWEAVRVHEKWFMLMTELSGEHVVILKSDPEEAEALRQSYADITPGYHMNKKHWITLAPGASLDEQLVRELVAESYRLVVANLPKSRRPINPQTFGSELS